MLKLMCEREIVEESFPLFELLASLHNTRSTSYARLLGSGVMTTESCRSIDTVDIIENLVIIFFIIHVERPWNAPATSRHTAPSIDRFLLGGGPASITPDVLIRTLGRSFLRSVHDSHALLVKREGLGKVSNVKGHSLACCCVANSEEEPLLMALGVSVNVQVQIVLSMRDVFGSVEVSAFEEGIEQEARWTNAHISSLLLLHQSFRYRVMLNLVNRDAKDDAFSILLERLICQQFRT